MTGNLKHPYSADNIITFSCINKKFNGKGVLKKVIAWDAEAGKESQLAFRHRMDLCIRPEISRYHLTGRPWVDFDPSEQNLLLPPQYFGMIMKYSGYGLMLSYSIKKLKSTLFAAGSDLKNCLKHFDSVDCTDEGPIELSGSLLIKYQNGMTLEINEKSRTVVWEKDDHLVSSYHMEETENVSGFLAALERYCEGGDLDGRYALFLARPLGIDLRELSLNQRGRLLDDELGL